jgi:hypothetical protein
MKLTFTYIIGTLYWANDRTIRSNYCITSSFSIYLILATTDIVNYYYYSIFDQYNYNNIGTYYLVNNLNRGGGQSYMTYKLNNYSFCQNKSINIINTSHIPNYNCKHII